VSEEATEPIAARPVTIYDVAAAAGVSASTVSRTFSRPGRVSARTARHVHEVAERLGYHADPTLTPVRRATRMIALAVSDITNPTYFGIIRGAEAAASERGYALVVVDTQESGTREHQHVTQLLPNLQGLVLASPRVPDRQLRLLAKQVPLVLVNRAATGVLGVVPDNARGIRRAVEHLADLEHARIAYVAGPENAWTDGIRWRAMREVALELGLAVLRVGPNAPTVSGGFTAAEAVLRTRATAVVAYNDMIAIGLQRGLLDRGVCIPEQVSIVGIDNTMSAGLVTPSLTSLGAAMLRLGEMAVANVIAVGAGGKWNSDRPLTVPMRLVVRDSTGPAPR
jgi:DNA-binding LacI/PurR family transcriptional regulator